MQLQVWEVATGKLLWEFHQRSVSDENWPVLHWQDDEALTFHMVTNTIQAHDPTKGFQGDPCLKFLALTHFFCSHRSKAVLSFCRTAIPMGMYCSIQQVWVLPWALCIDA